MGEKTGQEVTHSLSDSFVDLEMSAIYPNYEFANYNISTDVIYTVDYASFTLVVFAYIPEDCYFSISVDETTIMEITNQTLLDHTLVHNGTQVHIEFIGTNDSSIPWQGFLVRLFGENINPNNTYHDIIRSKSKTGLIVGLNIRNEFYGYMQPMIDSNNNEAIIS
uniref:CUB domain-containing protein n=1 Tax=Acrobeloides nanus TaxID=290746 RepID=A0A914EFF1_9BILA